MARSTPPDDRDHSDEEAAASLAEAQRAEFDHDDRAAGGLVKCRWLSPQPVVTGAPGPAELAAGVDGPVVVFYGDAIYLTAEQADDPNTPADRWADGWTPDPDVAALTPDLPKD